MIKNFKIVIFDNKLNEFLLTSFFEINGNLKQYNILKFKNSIIHMNSKEILFIF